MCMLTPFPSTIPEQTRQLVEPLLPRDSVYRLVGAEIDEIMSDEDFIDLYAEEGRPAVNPVVLALVSVFQFLEMLPDRAAAEAAVMRLDWKYALRQELAWTGFHYSDLSNFRKRLLAHGREEVVFDRIVGYLLQRGYIRGRGKQRTDATHVLGLVARLSRLELVWETIRVALAALLSANAPWVLKRLPSGFIRTHSQRRWDYRLSEAEVAREMIEAGREGYWLLEQLEAHGGPELTGLPEVIQLRRVLEEQYTRGQDGSIAQRPPGQSKGDVVSSPHDPEARYASKGGRGWVGYKVEVTETAEGEHRFITDVAIEPAIIRDNQCLDAIQERLVKRAITPSKQYVDQAYMSGAKIMTSRKWGIDLRGYVREGNTSKSTGFQLRDFDIDIEKRQAICPAGNRQVKWVLAKPNVKNLIAYHVSFGIQCQTCRFFGPDRCTDRPTGRKLGISRFHDLIQARRQEAANKAFKAEMGVRAGIEGTISEMVRGHGARHSRYRGKAKNHLQVVMVAAATNLKRLANACVDVRLLILFGPLRCQPGLTAP
jgi:transposase